MEVESCLVFPSWTSYWSYVSLSGNVAKGPRLADTDTRTSKTFGFTVNTTKVGTTDWHAAHRIMPTLPETN